MWLALCDRCIVFPLVADSFRVMGQRSDSRRGSEVAGSRGATREDFEAFQSGLVCYAATRRLDQSTISENS